MSSTISTSAEVVPANFRSQTEAGSEYASTLRVGAKFGFRDDGTPFATPGPLLTSIVAIFGKSSFFGTIAGAPKNSTANEEICGQLKPPFRNLVEGWVQYSMDCQIPDPGLRVKLHYWMVNFAGPEKTRQALASAIFFSHQAVLTQASALSGTGRQLKTSPGQDVARMSINPAAMAFISFLILVQLVALFALAIYSYQHPCWTESLDAFALLRLGAAMAEELPLISTIDSKEVPVLDEKVGWIGAAHDKQDEGECDTLVIGGVAAVKRDELYRMY